MNLSKMTSIIVSIIMLAVVASVHGVKVAPHISKFGVHRLHGDGKPVSGKAKHGSHIEKRAS